MEILNSIKIKKIEKIWFIHLYSGLSYGGSYKSTHSFSSTFSSFFSSSSSDRKYNGFRWVGTIRLRGADEGAIILVRDIWFLDIIQIKNNKAAAFNCVKNSI